MTFPGTRTLAYRFWQRIGEEAAGFSATALRRYEPERWVLEQQEVGPENTGRDHPCPPFVTSEDLASLPSSKRSRRNQ